MHRELNQLFVCLQKRNFFFPLPKNATKSPQITVHISVLVMKGFMRRPMCIRETVWFSHSIFTEYLNIKSSASIPHVHFSGGSEVRLPETTLLGVSQVLVRHEVSARLAVPLGSHILLLVHSTRSTHSQECFSPDLMPSESFHAIKAIFML